MAKYIDYLAGIGLMHKDLLNELQKAGHKIDKALLSKIINHVVLPTKPMLESICKTLDCHVLDLYNPDEIDLMSVTKIVKVKKKLKTNPYNLHVTIDRGIANKVINPISLKKLGIETLSIYIRECVMQLHRRLERMEAKEKATKDAATSIDD